MSGKPATPFNMAEYVLGRAVAACPDKTALVVMSGPARTDEAESWTFARLERASLGVAALLRQAGLEPGDRVFLRLENTSLFPLVYFGAMAGGFVPVPTSAELTEGEALFILDDSGARAAAVASRLAIPLPSGVVAFGDGELARAAERGSAAAYAPTVSEDPAFLVYTSGTSGGPKGVLHAHRSVLGRRPMYEGWYGIGPSDRMLHAGAFNWTFTLGTGLADPWANGATSIVYTGEKDPSVWLRLVNATEATLFAAVPSLYRRILKYARPQDQATPTLRHGLIAGEAPPSSLFDDWTAATGKPLYEALGMSEISTFVSSGPNAPRRAGAAGVAQPCRRIAILPAEGDETPLGAGEEGLLAVHASDPGLMLRYWNRPDDDRSARRGEWFLTGDLAAIDGDGYVTHRGRADDVMNASGYRVAPQEVEGVLALCPGVAEAACAEVEAKPGVSVIGAFIVAQGGSGLTADAVTAFAARRLASYKRPRAVVFLDSLPRTANGKVKRRDLPAMLAK